MIKKVMKLKADVIRWHQFSRRNDAVFRSLGREIAIGTLSVATLLVATPHTAQAQTVAPQQGERDREVALDEVTVTAGRVPLPMEQTARIVSVMTREQLKDCPAQSVNDLLKLCASVDVRQRGGFGIQTDINPVKKVLHKFGIAANGNPLIKGVKIIIIKSQAYRQPLDNKRR